MQTEALQQLLAEALPDCEVSVDTDGYHFTITAVGERFAGMRPVQRQQTVYAVIADRIADGSIHAVNIRARAPGE